jgi:hypothetical protein
MMRVNADRRLVRCSHCAWMRLVGSSTDSAARRPAQLSVTWLPRANAPERAPLRRAFTVGVALQARGGQAVRLAGPAART